MDRRNVENGGGVGEGWLGWHGVAWEGMGGHGVADGRSLECLYCFVLKRMFFPQEKKALRL